MQVFKDIFRICSCSIILCRCGALYIHSITLNWIKSSSIVCSFSNLQYLLAFHNRQRYFMIGSTISFFIDMNFVLLATTNLFLGLIFLLMIWLIFLKVRSSRFVGYTMVETFILSFIFRLASSCSQKKICNFIFSSLFLVVF